MENDLQSRLGLMEQKIDAIFVSVEKTRKYFLWILIITIAMVVIPAIGLVFAVPKFISLYGDILAF